MQPYEKKVLVVGTTPDYIDMIRKRRPGSTLFLTERALRQTAAEPSPSEDEEVLAQLSDHKGARELLRAHLLKWGVTLSCIVSYDCESMLLTAAIAEEHGLSYPSLRSIQNCRSKLLSKALWRKAGIGCPDSALVSTAQEASAFLHRHGDSCVLKPVSGSGSELVVVCHSLSDCQRAFVDISGGLRARRNMGLYSASGAGSDDIIAEQHINGSEYSCDFVMRSSKAEIIRLTRKVPREGDVFGITSAYVLEPLSAAHKGLQETLGRAAAALGLDNVICMADFMMEGDKVMLLEISPRPGGDCIPGLLRYATGMDTTLAAMDVASGRGVKIKAASDRMRYVGLRLHARRAGTIKGIDTSALRGEPDVLEVNLCRKPGHKVVLPPRDYDSWLLGHVIFRAEPDVDLQARLREIASAVVVEFETSDSRKTCGEAL